MPVVVIVLLASMAGCYFTTRDRETTVIADARTIEVPIKTFDPVVRATALDATIRAQVTVPRTCREDRELELRVTRWSEIDLTWVDWNTNDDVAIFLVVMSAPVTLPISLVFALIEAQPPRTIRKQAVERGGLIACPSTSRQGAHFQLPSGATVTVVTDTAGRAELAIPPTEPPSGTVVVRANGGQAVRVDYVRDRATCIASHLPAVCEQITSP